MKRGERLLYFTTCGWMMWNWQVSALACEATLALYDGSPFHPDGNALFDYVAEEGIETFGTSAKYIDAVKKAGLAPAKSHDLSKLRAILSTGSPLVPESFDFVYRSIKRDLCLSSISAAPTSSPASSSATPPRRCIAGRSSASGSGSTCTPSTKTGAASSGRRASWSARAPSRPCRWVSGMIPAGASTTTPTSPASATSGATATTWRSPSAGGVIIHGRSDAVLNPGGVRIGTAEIYRQVEQLDEVVESLVIAQQWEGDVRIVLFVILREGIMLDGALESKIRSRIRANATPRHVPARIVQVTDIPRTRSGKITELAVRDVVHGRAVKNREALANPQALEQFANRPELKV